MRLCFIGLPVLATVASLAWGATMDPDQESDRKQAKQLLAQGNAADAYVLFRALALDDTQPNTHLAADFNQAVVCLQSLNRQKEFDDLLSDVLDAHSGNWRLLHAAADILTTQIPSEGYLIGGTFERGAHRGGGKYVSSATRDKVHGLQLLVQAVELMNTANQPDAPTADERFLVYQSLGRLISNVRFAEAWKLQDLTDLAVLPDYEEANRYHYRFPSYGTSKGAPVDAAGNPIFYDVPASWDAAKSDGERWRWVMNEAKLAQPKRRSLVDYDWALFLNSQFGVHNAGLSAPVFRSGSSKGDVQAWVLQDLKDSDTVAKLATGIRQLTLPAEYNHLSILQDIISRDDEQANQARYTLLAIRMSRFQYPQAVKILQTLIASAPNKNTKAKDEKQLNQIVGNWVQFENAKVNVADQPTTLDIRFRNGVEIQFEAREINMELLLNDVKSYLQSGPQNLDQNLMTIETIGYRLLNDAGAKKYLGRTVARWTTALKTPSDHFDGTMTVTTPLQSAGSYLVTGKINDGNQANIVIDIADTAITRKKVESGTLYFVADAATGSPIAKADLEFFGWDQKRVQGTRNYAVETRRLADRTNESGLCVPAAERLESRFRWLTIARTADGRTAYDGFQRVWRPQQISNRPFNSHKVYAITDRPIYRPGHDVKFRMWYRQASYFDDSQAHANQEFEVRIRNPKGDFVYETKVKSDKWAGVDGNFTLPENAALGQYQLLLGSMQTRTRTRRINGKRQQVTEDYFRTFGSGTFQVEEYRKPEFKVTVEAPEKPVRLGQKIQATIKADYYFGAPVTEATVKYKVERSPKDARWYPVARWDWLYNNGYWWFGYDYDWYPGWKKWGCAAPVMPWWNWNPNPPEVVAEGEASIGQDGTYNIEIDTAAALKQHGDSDHQYSISVEVVDQSRRTILGNGSVLVARDPFKVFVWPNQGHYQTGDNAIFQGQARTPDGKPVAGAAKLRLLSLSYKSPANNDSSEQNTTDTSQVNVTETEVAAWDLTTDEEGRFKQKVNLPKSGQYRLSVVVTDSDQNSQEGAYVFYVRGTNENGNSYRFDNLELIVDKQQYTVGDTVNLQVNTNNSGGTVLLFVRPANGLAPKPQILKLDGKSTTFPMTVGKRDQPNFFVEALTISNGEVHNEVREIFVPPQERVAKVDVLPGANRYRPGEHATVKLKLTGLDGQPFVGNTVISIYDASLDSIAASTIPEIRSFFWNLRRNHRPGFDSTLTQISSPVSRNGEFGMLPLATGFPAFAAAPFGVASPNRFFSRGRSSRSLGVVEAEMSMADGAVAAPAMAMQAEPLAIGRVAKTSVEKQDRNAGKEVSPVTRTNFAETAFWNANVTSDENGIAEISFQVPDNLTTWKIKAWTLGEGTRVGSGDSEIICSKDLIIRPQAPRFFTETDTMVVSAVVHNYLDSAKATRVIFESEGGQLKLQSDATQEVTIPAGEEVRIDWNVQVIASGDTKIRMKAFTDEESDAVEISVPVKVHGLLKTESWAGVIRPNESTPGRFTINVPAARIPQQSRLEIRYSPTLATAMVDALPYLVDYPYGCTEQTLNRFLPAVLTQKTLQSLGVNLEDINNKRTNLNSQELGNAADRAAQWKRFQSNPVFDEEELENIINTGVTDLTNMQLSDGGWGWFSGYGERSSVHLTAQVVHGLTLAKQNDVPILPDVLKRGIDWLKSHQTQQLALLQEGDQRRKLSDLGKTKQLEKRKKKFKMAASNIDAFVAFVLSAHDVNSPKMADYLYRDRVALSVYAKALTGLVLHDSAKFERRDMLLRNIEQTLVQDDENQTAWLEMPQNSWWYWYGSENEAMARYLQLLLKVDPANTTAPRLVKYLLNNRKHGTYWNSTRDTALVVEALSDYIKVTAEANPDMEVEIVIDGVVQKTVTITSQNLFSFDNSVVLSGDAVKTGEHMIEIRRKGSGPLYYNAYLTNFSQEDFISATGLEIKVSRKFYRLIPDDKQVSVQGDRGQVVRQKTAKYRRQALDNFASVNSGDLIEVEMLIDSKNDYEYLLLEDHKPSGFETDDQRSGYVYDGLRAYRELRDDRVSFFLSRLARGQHSISYRIRAETPSQQVSALPSKIEGMYAPELVGNSDELKLRVNDRE